MEFSKKYKAKCGIYEAVIEEDLPEVGFYLYIWQNGIGQFEYLQDTVDICKYQAFEEFGIPLDCWEEVLE